MSKKHISLLINSDLISASLTLPPFLFQQSSKFIEIYTNLKKCLRIDKNKVLIVIRGKKYKIDDFQNLREKYKKLIYIHDNDNCAIDLEIYKIVDLYIKKQHYKNQSIYFKKLLSNTIYGDYYIRKDNYLEKDIHNIKINKLNKLRLCPNICWSNFSPNSLKRKIFFRTVGLNLKFYSYLILHNYKKELKKLKNRNQKNFDGQRNIFSYFNCHGYSEGEGFQRKIISNILKLNNDNISYHKYKKLLKSANVILSPFGWGEICFRDREAYNSGGVLLKPNMNHIETFPNLYKEKISYISLKWDLSNLKEAKEESIEKSYDIRWLKQRDLFIFEELLEIEKKCLNLNEEIFSLC